MLIYRDSKTGRFISKQNYFANEKPSTFYRTSAPSFDIAPIKNKPQIVLYRNPKGQFISKSEYEHQFRTAPHSRERLAPLENGVEVRNGPGNRYSIYVKATSRDGYTTYHELIQGSTKVNKEGEKAIRAKAREKYDHHGKIKLELLHTIDRADGHVIRGNELHSW